MMAGLMACKYSIALATSIFGEVRKRALSHKIDVGRKSTVTNKMILPAIASSLAY